MTGGPLGFWEATPRILAAAVKAAVQRAENEHRSAAWLAWTTAVLGRAKQIPALDSLIKPSGRSQPAKPQSWQDQLAVAQAWAA